MIPSNSYVTTSVLALCGIVTSYKVYHLFRSSLSTYYNELSTHSILLIVDIGTSSIRCSAYSHPSPDSLTANEWKYIEHSMQSIQCHTLHTIEGTADFNDILNNVNQVMDEMYTFLGKAKLTKNVIAIGITTFCMNIFGIDKEGNAVTPVYTYATRNEEIAESMRELRKQLVEMDMLKEAYERTGTPLHTSYAPCHLYHYSKTKQNKVYKWQTISSGIIAHWTEQSASPVTYTEASWMGLLDWKSKKWYYPLLDLIGLEKSELPGLRSYTKCIDGFQGEYAAQWKEIATVKLFSGIPDGFAATVGSQCFDHSYIAATMGTTSALRVVLPEEKVGNMPLPDGLWCYYLENERVLVGGALSDGGSVYDWLHNTLLFKLDRSVDLGESMRIAAQMFPDSHGLTILPFLNGERAPGWNDNAKSAINGITKWTTSIHFLRAYMEAIILRLTAILDLILELIPDDQVVIAASGKGFSSSLLWRQILADASNHTVIMETGNLDRSTSYGAAYIFSRVLYPYPSAPAFAPLPPTAQISDSMPMKDISISEPNPQYYSIYRLAKDRQQRLYDMLYGMS